MKTPGKLYVRKQLVTELVIAEELTTEARCCPYVGPDEVYHPGDFRLDRDRYAHREEFLAHYIEFGEWLRLARLRRREPAHQE